jgi:hypothetical protein
MNRFIATLIFLLLAMMMVAPASTPPAPMLAEEEKPGDSGWWETLSARKWEFSFMPGETRYGFRIPVYPALACIVLIISCGSLLDTAQRQKKSGVATGVAMGAGTFLLLILLWQAAFREPKTHVPKLWNSAGPAAMPRPLILAPPSESLLRTTDPTRVNPRPAESSKNVPPSNSTPPAKPSPP